MNNKAVSAAIDLLVGKGVDLSNVLSEGGLLKQLTKHLVEKALQSEMNRSSRLRQIRPCYDF